MRKLTVLHFTGYELDIGGVNTFIRNLAFNDVYRSIMVIGPDFVQQRKPQLKLLRGPKFEAEEMSVNAFIKAWKYSFHLLCKLRRNQHLIFHGHSRTGLLIALLINLWGCHRALATVHCYGKQKWFYRICARIMGSRLLWLSPAMKAYYGLDSDSWSHCLPSPMPVLNYEQFPKKKKLRKGRTKLRLGGLGNLESRKGWHVLLEALSLLNDQERKQIQFYHYGTVGNTEKSKKYEKYLRQIIYKHRLDDVVVFKGWVNDPWLVCSPSIDWIVMPSFNEPFSITLLEALSHGIPVLGADSGGIPDVIVHSQNGLLFNTEDAYDLSRKIRLIMEAKPNISEEAVLQSVIKFQAPHLTQKWVEKYQSFAY